MPEIETARLQLRHFNLNDFDYLFRLYSDAEVMKYLLPRTREQTQASLNKHIQQWQQHNFGMWAVIYKETGAMIGLCGLGFLENTKEVELGYVLDKSYWNMGLATDSNSHLEKNQRKFCYLNRELVSKHHLLTDNYHPTLEIDRF